jgi:hypothetical protein
MSEAKRMLAKCRFMIKYFNAYFTAVFLFLNFIFVFSHILTGSDKTNTQPGLQLVEICVAPKFNVHHPIDANIGSIKIDLIIRYKYAGPVIKTRGMFEGIDESCEIKGHLGGFKEDTGMISSIRIDIIHGYGSTGSNRLVDDLNGKSSHKMTPYVILENDAVKEVKISVDIFEDLSERQEQDIIDALTNKKLAFIKIRIDGFRYHWEITGGQSSIPGLVKGDLDLKINRTLRIDVIYDNNTDANKRSKQ